MLFHIDPALRHRLVDLHDASPHALALERTALASWSETLLAATRHRLEGPSHGLRPQWEASLVALRDEPDGAWGIGADGALTLSLQEEAPSDSDTTRSALQALHPWRKGPWRYGDVFVDSEWRSNRKWARLAPALPPIEGALVLDVGCGNGYTLWRLADCGAKAAVGIDPSWLFLAQSRAAILSASSPPPLHHFLAGAEDLPSEAEVFDLVLSMGVLYHRPSPFDHLHGLKGQLRSGGTLILETLVIEGDEHQVLVPPERYAQMNNVWFIPSPDALRRWLAKAGFVDVELCDCTTTSTEEQRSTEWMRYHSLANFLDPKDPARTAEGHPAPRRAVFRAIKP